MKMQTWEEFFIGCLYKVFQSQCVLGTRVFLLMSNAARFLFHSMSTRLRRAALNLQKPFKPVSPKKHEQDWLVTPSTITRWRGPSNKKWRHAHAQLDQSVTRNNHIRLRLCVVFTWHISTSKSTPSILMIGKDHQIKPTLMSHTFLMLY
jgi:hypothetical protein